MDRTDITGFETTEPQRPTLSGWAGATLFAFAALAVGFVFLSQRNAEERARQNFLSAVARAHEVQLGGQPVTDPTPILLTLRLIDHVPAHHSSPGKPIALVLAEGSNASVFVLARDSAAPTEFWVFDAGPDARREGLGEYAGRITSSDLDRILRSRGL